jgi:hypothetical protein
MFDYFPIVDDDIPVAAVLRHGRHDPKRIPKSRLHMFQVHSKDIYTDSQFHSRHSHPTSSRPVMLTPTLAHRFDRAMGNTAKVEAMVLIRRGVEIIMLGEAWKLTHVVFEEESTHLHYRVLWQTLSTTMKIIEHGSNGSKLRGEYRIVEM